jgi:hypothetical protein
MSGESETAREFRISWEQAMRGETVPIETLFGGETMTNQRQIKPHKGGRSERAYIRLTPDEKRRVDAELQRTGLSLADYVMRCVDASQPARRDESEDASPDDPPPPKA